MSEVATYGLYVDWNNDGDFSDAGEDITADFISATIQRGFSSPLARTPGVARATFIVLNTAKTYSPPLHATVLPRRQVKFDMTYGGTTVTLFRGYLDDIQPDFGQYSERRAKLTCVDAQALLDMYEGEIAMLTNIYADDVIEAVVSAVYTPPGTAYQSGVNPFPTSAEGWTVTETIRASQKIQDACTSDWGKFFIGKNGYPTFYNRHQMPLDSTTELTLSDTMLNLDYVKAVADVYNYIEITCYPRSLGQVREVLGRLSQTDAPRLEAGASQLFLLRFRDPINAKIQMGGYSCTTPAATTDYTATDDPTGLGNDETANVTASATFYGDHAEVTLTNAAAYPVYIQTLQVRGYAVRAREPVTVIAQDATSITAYQKRKLSLQAPLISDPQQAQELADYLLSYYKDPLNNVSGIEILANKDATWMAAVRDLELEDRVVITETQVGLSAWAGYIYSLNHNIVNRYQHRLTFALEQAPTVGTPFRLDTSALNSGHTLIY